MATAEGLTAIAPASTSTRPRTTLAPRCRLGWSPRRPFTRRTAGPTALCPNSGSEPAQLRRSWSKSAGSSPLPSTAACPRRPPRPHQPPRLRRPRRSSPVHWRRLSARGNDLTHARTQKWVSMFAIGECLFFQLGEAMQIVSGGFYHATEHCVRGPPRCLAGYTRASLAVFFQPHAHEDLPLPPGTAFQDVASRAHDGMFRMFLLYQPEGARGINFLRFCLREGF
mmetsp:Transcript_977/g.3964  ORF Transcript_977/g.3964 Transcript_977/m.3964 type:complete len:225 (-) Transcript_977:86-760(-)